MIKNNRKHISDIIGDSFKKWENEHIILDGGTGSGKSYFCINILGEFVQAQKKTMLYLCNRKKLKEQIYDKVKRKNLKQTIYVTTYQLLQSKILDGENICHYDYIVADECHYFTTDAIFNNYTDVSYQYLMKQRRSTILWASATAKGFFDWLCFARLVKAKNVYRIDRDYSYVERVYIYQKDELSTLIDEIINREPDNKIVIYCNSARRMKEMNRLYGDKANYFCSSYSMDKELRAMCEYYDATGQVSDCIKEYEDGRISFDKQVLFTTAALDNGMDLKDKKIRYIFSEIVNVDSMIQSLGRKRSLDVEDTCVFYIREYSKQVIQGMLNETWNQLEPVKAYKKNYDAFVETYGKGKARDKIRRNKIFYSYFSYDKALNNIKVNECKYRKYEQDNMILLRMKEQGYIDVVKEFLGYQLACICEDAGVAVEKIDGFKKYLESMEEKMLFREDRDRIKEAFEDVGVKLRYIGICTFNGALDDMYQHLYQPRFYNKDSNGEMLVDRRRTLENGSPNPNRNKTYWILQ